ncbi:MAG: aspartate carbamoyltransferase regulatory subunit [Candidatus Hodarchaeales archaeon]
MNSDEKELVVAKIQNGIVIDHIKPPGRVFYALKVLNIDETFPHAVFVAINVPSKKLGRKDVLKICNIKEEDLDLDRLGLIIPGSNVIYIKDYHVIAKQPIQAPDRIHGIVKCPGISCITNRREDVVPEFIVIDKNEPIRLRCAYCDAMFYIHEKIALMR